MALIQATAPVQDDPVLLGYERQRLDYERLCAELDELKSLPAITADLKSQIEQAERAKMHIECQLARYPLHRPL